MPPQPGTRMFVGQVRRHPARRRSSDASVTLQNPMPKRPPRVVRELPVPKDLHGSGPTCALAVAAGKASRGELWHADALDLLGKLADGSVDLVIADPPYAIAKAEWDEFESIDAY